MKKRVVLFLFLFLTFGFKPFGFSAPNDLDELIARKDRKTTSTFYSGESSTNYYFWQPQTLCYTDTTSGHEVWVMTCTDDATSFSGHEYGHQPWSADGNRLSIALNKDTSAFTRGNFAFNSTWFTARSDGTYMRPRVNSKARTRVHNAYTHWSPTIPDVYYIFGRNYASEGGSYGHLYKETVSDTSIASTDWMTFAADERDLPKDAVSSDGKYVIATKNGGYTCISVGNVTTQTLAAALTDYDIDLGGLDTNWGDTPASFSAWHDEMFVNDGADGYWIYFLPGGSHTWWRMRPWGTDGNAPTETRDTTSPYTWWMGTDAQKEVQPLNSPATWGTQPFVLNYWSHAVPDRWGNHIAYSDVDGAYVAPAVCYVDNMTRVGFPDSAKGAQYHAWTGWTDYTCGTDGADNIYIMKYNDGSTHKEIAAINATIGSMFTKPGQSPDGTKTAYRSDFLQPTPTNGDVFYVVTYYPYPPEITQASASSGTVTIRFDWQNTLADPNPRTYTARGWPDEATDDRPIPRETKKFRLWRSTDQSIWTPIKTTNAEIFSRYDFSDGTWIGNNYWEITDVPGNGTWYYTVTSLEWSGLESHVLSNVYTITISGGSGTGSQSSAYPNNPGGDSNFYTTNPTAPSGVTSTYRKSPATALGQYTIEWNKPNDKMVRYFNIYAEDGSAPTVSQVNRIASIPASAFSGTTCSWVDWLGNQNGTTQYVVTSVDYQGNEGITAPFPGTMSNFKIQSVQQ